MSSQQFIELLYGQLPQFVRDEAELRALWIVPDTRSKLLQGLAEKGFGAEQLAEMPAIISAEHSDLFDVLAHVAYALPPLAAACRNWPRRNSPPCCACTIATPSPADAVADLGQPEEIGRVFASFQKYLDERSDIQSPRC